jgi:hypothetical protein
LLINAGDVVRYHPNRIMFRTNIALKGKGIFFCHEVNIDNLFLTKFQQIYMDMARTCRRLQHTINSLPNLRTAPTIL